MEGGISSGGGSEAKGGERAGFASGERGDDLALLVAKNVFRGVAPIEDGGLAEIEPAAKIFEAGFAVVGVGWWEDDGIAGFGFDALLEGEGIVHFAGGADDVDEGCLGGGESGRGFAGFDEFFEELDNFVGRGGAGALVGKVGRGCRLGVQGIG